MRMTRLIVIPAAALALLAAGCGDDENKSEPAASNTGEDAVKQTVLDFTFEGDCDTMTDKFLETQAFIGETRKERCDYFAKTFQKPQYKESDVKFRKVEVTGDKAVVTIGSDLANITSDYTLVAAGGKWQIDEVDIGSS